MPMIIVSAYCSKEKIKQLDSFIKSPVSRSQVFDAMIEYVLKSPEFLHALINNELEKINVKIQNSENSI